MTSAAIYDLDDSGWAAAEAVVKEWTGIAFRVGPMDGFERVMCVDAVERLYRVAGMEPPPRQRIIIVPSPTMAQAVAGAAAWIWHCRREGGKPGPRAVRPAVRGKAFDTARAAVEAATFAPDEPSYSHARPDRRKADDRAIGRAAGSRFGAGRLRHEIFNRSVAEVRASVWRHLADSADRAVRGALDAATSPATLAGTSEALTDAIFRATDIAARRAAAVGTRRDAEAAVHAILAACADLAGAGGIACASAAGEMADHGNEHVALPALIAFGRDHARLHERGLVDPALYERWQPWEDLTRISGWRFMHKDFCIVSDRCVALHLDAENRLHNENGPARLWADGFAIHAVHGVVGAPAGELPHV